MSDSDSADFRPPKAYKFTSKLKPKPSPKPSRKRKLVRHPTPTGGPINPARLDSDVSAQSAGLTDAKPVKCAKPSPVKFRLPSPDAPGWLCNGCTFRNHELIAECEMCGGVQPSGSVSDREAVGALRAILPDLASPELHTLLNEQHGVSLVAKGPPGAVLSNALLSRGVGEKQEAPATENAKPADTAPRNPARTRTSTPACPEPNAANAKLNQPTPPQNFEAYVTRFTGNGAGTVSVPISQSDFEREVPASLHLNVLPQAIADELLTEMAAEGKSLRPGSRFIYDKKIIHERLSTSFQIPEITHTMARGTKRDRRWEHTGFVDLVRACKNVVSGLVRRERLERAAPPASAVKDWKPKRWRVM